MNKKLIFLDIDGTLTAPGHHVPPESALAAVREARAAGHRVFLASGRSLDALSPLLRLGFDGAIASAGGYIVCGGQVLYDHPMTKAQLETIQAVLRRHNVFFIIEAQDAAYAEGDLRQAFASSAGGDSEFRRWKTIYEQELGVRPIAQYGGQPVYKVVCIYHSPSQIEEARSLLEGEFVFCGQSIPSDSWLNTELINRAFDKGQAVNRVCRRLGVDPADTIAFGDGPNDLEMIRTAGLGVCMENGCQALKDISDRICPPVDQDGLAAGFRSLGLV